MMSEPDPRFLRTHQLIQTAFIELVLLKPFSKITIEDIAEHASINRSTFYLHYKNIFELLNEFIIGGFTLDEGAPCVHDLYTYPDAIIQRTIHGMEFMFANPSLMKTVFREYQINPYFKPFYDTHLSIQYCIQKSLAGNQIPGFRPDTNIAKFVLAGQSRLLDEWVDNKPGCSLEYLATYYNVLQLKATCALLDIIPPPWVKDFKTTTFSAGE